MRAVSTGHADHLGTAGDGLLGQSTQVVARRQHDRLDASPLRLLDEVKSLHLAVEARIMVNSLSSSLLWRCTLAVVSGSWRSSGPPSSSARLSSSSPYALLAAIADAARAFASDRVGPVAGYLLLALLSIAPAG